MAREQAVINRRAYSSREDCRRASLDDARMRCVMGPTADCDFETLHGGIDRSGLVPDMTVLRCRRCGIGFTQPPLKNVAFLYADRTSQDFQQTTRGAARWIKRLAFRLQARRLLKQLQFQPQTVIDFACGSGLLTSCVIASLPKSARVVACDFHAEPPAELGDLEYRPLDRLDDLIGSADLVLAMHVIEHDDDAHGLLTRIASLAKSGGQIVIEVPNIDCKWTSLFGWHWDAWYLPYHRTHFSRTSLRALVEFCGLTIVGEHNISLPTMGRSVANVVHRRNGPMFIFLSAALQPVQWAVEKFTHQPSALRVIARKP